jgi:hypothetical protein
VIETLSRRGDVSDGIRRKHLQELAALHDDPWFVKTYLDGLINGPILRNPEKSEELIALAESAGVRGELVEQFRRDLSRRVQITDYTQVMERLLGPGSQATSETQHDGYGRWASRDPLEALVWAEKGGRVDLIAQQVKNRSDEMLRSAWQPGDSSAPWWERNIKVQYESWHKHDASAAEDWLRTTPMDMRQFLAPHGSHR